MAKKALGRDLRDLLSQARPSRLIEGGAAGGAAERTGGRREDPQNEPARTVPTAAPGRPTVAPRPFATESAPPPALAATTRSPQDGTGPAVPGNPFSPAAPGAESPAPISPADTTSRPVRPAYLSVGKSRLASSPPPPVAPGPFGRTLRTTLGSSGNSGHPTAGGAAPDGTRRGWVYFVVADLLFLVLAGYFVVSVPWGRAWSYGIAGGCLILALLTGCLLPIMGGAPRRLAPRERPRSERPRVHVQLTRL